MTDSISSINRIDTVEYSDPTGSTNKDVPRQNNIYIGYDSQRSQKKICIRAERKFQETEEWCLHVIGLSTECRLVNLGPQPVDLKFKDASTINRLNPQPEVANSVICETVMYGEPVKIEDYTFTFHRQRRSPSFAVELEPPEGQLARHHSKHNPLAGTIKLKNTGPVKQVQFRLELVVEGLPQAAYHLDTTRVKLDYEQETDVKYSLYHPDGRPLPAGEYQVAVYARTNDYGSETSKEAAADFGEVEVQPFYDFTVELVTPYPCSNSSGGER